MLYIVRKADPRRVISLNLGGTRARPHVLIPLSRDPAKRDQQEIDELVQAVAEKRGLDANQLMGDAEEAYRKREKIYQARLEIRRRQEGNGLWVKRGGRWVMR